MSSDKEIPATWRIASDYDPNDHMMSLKGKAYLDVANRLLWFVRDQRDFIVRGVATCNYIIRSELVEQDRQAGFAQFKTYVRDVLGNEATMYGSETAKDFGDYAEKASTKSLGRALAMLGYGTAAAPEMDEGDRIVDTPVERERKQQPAPPAQQSAFVARPPVIHPAVDEPTAKEHRKFATPDQWTRLRKACELLSIEPPEAPLEYGRAENLLHEYMETWKRLSAQRQREGATR